MNLVLYGPPGSGKTTVGQAVARQLGREFVDLDQWVEARWSRPVADYFEQGEEIVFRAREREACRTLATRENLVIAPGGGALLDPHSRAVLEGTGCIVSLVASLETLLARLEGDQARPLLRGALAERLATLLRERAALYQSFAAHVVTDALPVAAVVERVIALFQTYGEQVRFELGDCSAVMGAGVMAQLHELMPAKQLRAPHLIISDATVASLHHLPLTAPSAVFPAGEAHKNLATVNELYAQCVAHNMERGGTLLALGGGVVGDVAGFVAATFMRGVAWVNLPTTTLAMVDASLGGKTGVDLPAGKNLVGAFHPPHLILADYDLLATLPLAEARNGMAEVIKAALIGDADLFARLSTEVRADHAPPQPQYLPRAAAVKVGIVNADPFERGERAKLNLGHTIGHGIEAASGYALKHGEAIAIGLVAEACLAERIGLASIGLADEIKRCLKTWGLPTACPGLDPTRIRVLMNSDKKKANARLKFALPRAVGEVEFGVEVEERLIEEEIREIVK